MSREESIKAQALGLGFDLVGITRLGPAETATHFERWLDEGRAGEMGYLQRGAALRADTRLPYDGVTSAVVVALDYGGKEPPGPVARYARGDDYHELMWRRLDKLHAWLNQHFGREVRGRGFVDTGPILERDLARRAGLGWFGKNTNLINPGIGSFFFIGALLVDLELESDEPFQADRCGTCTRCLEACPTNAFVAPRELDATRCISYQTIENRGAIPIDLREAIGTNMYGCDICQDVCPWNVSFASELQEQAFAPREALRQKDAGQLAREVLAMSEDDYRAAFKGSAMKRAKLSGLKRNAAVVLGNVGTPDDAPLLEASRAETGEHADWALAAIERKGFCSEGWGLTIPAFRFPPIRPRSVMANVSARNNVQVSGTGTQPMIFAHGFGCDQNMWRFVAPAFADDYRIVLFDYVGSGKSDLAAYDAKRYSRLDGYADDVLDVIHELDLRDVVFVGHSVSSMVGVLAANREPDRFSRLILIGPSPRYVNEAPDYVGGFERADIEGLLETMDKNYIGWANYLAPAIMKNADRPELGAELTESFCSTDPVIARHFAEVTFYADNREDLRRVSVPSLVLQCAEDIVAPQAVGDFVHRHTPHSTLKQMQATGHCPHMSAPDETIALMREYLRAPVVG